MQNITRDFIYEGDSLFYPIEPISVKIGGSIFDLKFIVSQIS